MNSSFEQTIERFAIDADIRDPTARFSDAVNRRDFNAFGDLFADDGAWEIGEPFPSRAAGRQNVTTMFKNLWAPWDFFFQMTHSGVIDVAADRQTATARWEIQEIARTPDVRSLTTTWPCITTGSCGRLTARGGSPNGATTTSGSAALISEVAPSLARMTWHNRADGAPAPSHPGPPSRWPTDSLGESLVLVGDLENRRAELEERFLPLANPRAGTTDRAAPCRDHRHCLPCRDSRRRTLEEPARPGRSPPRGGSRCALGGPMATGQNPSPTTPSKYSWTTDGAPQSSTPFSWICAAAFACAAVLAATFITGPRRPTQELRPALIQTPVPHLTCPVAFPSAPDQARPDSSQASGRSFAADAPSPSRPG
jgi:ketosteroid isomerase-like protein